MKFTRYCRSILFTPALAEKRFGKGQEAGADVSLVDLEDSVSPLCKEEARQRARAFFELPRRNGCRLAIRVNAVTHHDGLMDLLALREYSMRPDIIMIPKVESPRDLEIVEQVLGEIYSDTDLMAVIETARGLENVGRIASAQGRLTALVFGSADFSFGIGADLEWDPLCYARAQLVTSARAHDIQVVDSALFDVDDLDGLVSEARRAKSMGFSGKAAVHPRQVAIINDAFSPDEKTFATARKIVEASDATQGNICVVEGRMIGFPFIDAARRLLAEFSPPAAQ